MKKLFSILLGLIMSAAMCSFAACAGNGANNTYSDDEHTGGSENNGGLNTPETPYGDSDVLIVYFSATGNTERVADYIAEATGGELFELVPVDEYTSDDLRWTDENSRVVQEYENPELRDIELVSATVENWPEYDMVFIGYPIWWGIAAWPVNGFVEDNDFTGKTVIPFCTSSSSGIGQSGELLAETAGSGDWAEGHRFGSHAAEDDVTGWLQSIGVI